MCLNETETEGEAKTKEQRVNKARTELKLQS